MKTFFCLMILAAALTGRSQSSEALLAYNSNEGGIASGTAGWSFQPLTNISVTALGAFQYVMAINMNNIEVGLWDANGTLLASNTITMDSPLVNQSQYELITPVLLNAGKKYYLGAYSEGMVINAYLPDEPNDPGPVTMASGIQLGAAVSSTNADFEFPIGEEGSPGSAVFAPNFEFRIVPTLCISCTGSNMVISWPAGFTNFILQSNNDLATTNWATETNCVNVIGEERQVQVSSPTGNIFYRLKSE